MTLSLEDRLVVATEEFTKAQHTAARIDPDGQQIMYCMARYGLHLKGPERADWVAMPSTRLVIMQSEHSVYTHTFDLAVESTTDVPDIYNAVQRAWDAIIERAKEMKR